MQGEGDSERWFQAVSGRVLEQEQWMEDQGKMSLVVSCCLGVYGSCLAEEDEVKD